MITQHWGGETPRPWNPRNESESLANLPSSPSAGSLGTPPDDTESVDAGPDRSPVRIRMPLAGGWVKLSRFWLGHHLLQNAWLFRLYVWCLLRANHKPGQSCGWPLASGEFLTGRKSGAAALSVDEGKFWRGLLQLVDQGLIQRTSHPNGTVVRVSRWKTYQGRDPSAVNDPPGPGFVVLYRSLRDTELMTQDRPLRLFLWCLLKAGFTHREVQGQHLDPGQFLTGHLCSASDLELKPDEFRQGLQGLAEQGWITLRPRHEWTIVTICNWEQEQFLGDSSRTADEQPTTQPANSERTAVDTALETADEHKRRKRRMRSIQDFKTEKNSTSPSLSHAVADSGSDQSIPVVVGGELDRIVERLKPLVDVNPHGLARIALSIHPADRIHRIIDYFVKWRSAWRSAGALAYRLKIKLDDSDQERGWPPKDSKVEAKLTQESGKKRQADRLDRERQRESEEHEARTKAYNAQLAALEPAYGAKVDALSRAEIDHIAKQNVGVRLAIKADRCPRNALLLAFSEQDGHSKQLPTDPELALHSPPARHDPPKPSIPSRPSLPSQKTQRITDSCGSTGHSGIEDS